ALAGERLGAAVEVGVRRVPRRDLERHLLAAARDPDRDAALLQRERAHDRAVHRRELAVERRGARRPRLAEDLDRLTEPAQALRGLREPVAVGAPLVLVPSGADPHLGAAARDDVDGRGDLGEVRRVAVTRARAHLAEPDPARRETGRAHAGTPVT